MISSEYSTVVKLSPIIARQRIIECYYHKAKRNISETARLCGISRNTVSKWLKRFLPKVWLGIYRFGYLMVAGFWHQGQNYDPDRLG